MADEKDHMHTDKHWGLIHDNLMNPIEGGADSEAYWALDKSYFPGWSRGAWSMAFRRRQVHRCHGNRQQQ